MLVNFGDFIDGKEDKVANPYIQLLPTTDDIAEAHNDFVQVRLKGVDSTPDQLLMDTYTPSGPPDVNNGKSKSQSGFLGWLQKNKIILIAVGASLSGLLLITIAALCLCRRTNVRHKGGKKRWFMQGGSTGGKGGYRQIPVPSAEKV